MRYLAVALVVLVLAGCGGTVTTGGRVVGELAAPTVPVPTRLYTAADVVAAFRAHGLAAVDPRPYVASGLTPWYDQRPAGDYTIETILTPATTAPGLIAGVVWVAKDDATTEAITAYVAGLRDMSAGNRQYRHYRMGNVLLFFYFLGGQFDESVLAR